MTGTNQRGATNMATCTGAKMFVCTFVALGLFGSGLGGARGVDAMYVPGTFPSIFLPESTMPVKVGSLQSAKTNLPFDYYSLPFCRPPEGIKHIAENLGEMLMGDRIQNSPYKFFTLREERSNMLCSVKLTTHMVKKLTRMINRGYHSHFTLNNLPVTTNVLDEGEGEVTTGFPIGEARPQIGETGLEESEPVFAIYNHLVFNVLVHEADTVQQMKATGTTRVKKALAQAGTGYTVVGFEIMPCSVRHSPDVIDAALPLGNYSSTTNLLLTANTARIDPVDCFSAEPQVIKVGETVTFSYDVLWQKSNITWVTRWDAYLAMDGEQIHWFSIMNSLLVVCFLTGVLLIIMVKTVRKDLARYNELELSRRSGPPELAAKGASMKPVASATSAAESLLWGGDGKDDGGWKMIANDVFRPPRKVDLLCLCVGTGVQLLGMAVLTLVFAALGFMSPAKRGALLTTMVVLYLMCSIGGSYCAVRMQMLLRTGTRAASVDMLDSLHAGSSSGSAAEQLANLPWTPTKLAWRVSSTFPGVAGAVLAFLNIFIATTGSSGAVPFSVFFSLFFLWFAISVPLSLIGAHLAVRAPKDDLPVVSNQIPRQIPAPPVPGMHWIAMLGAGILPFGTVFIEVYFIFSSIWMHRVYYVFGILLIVLLLNIVVTAEVSIALTYLKFVYEDYHWWWNSFLSGGSIAIYIMLYAMSYLMLGPLMIVGPVPYLVFMMYSGLISLSVFFVGGAISTLASLAFTRYIFNAIKLE